MDYSYIIEWIEICKYFTNKRNFKFWNEENREHRSWKYILYLFIWNSLKKALSNILYIIYRHRNHSMLYLKKMFYKKKNIRNDNFINVNINLNFQNIFLKTILFYLSQFGFCMSCLTCYLKNSKYLFKLFKKTFIKTKCLRCHWY